MFEFRVQQLCALQGLPSRAVLFARGIISYRHAPMVVRLLRSKRSQNGIFFTTQVQKCLIWNAVPLVRVDLPN